MASHRPLLVFKKGVCKHSDAERVRRNSGENLRQLIKLVCDDWNIPVLPSRFVSKWSADYYGQFIVQSFCGEKSYRIEINSPAFYKVEDSTTPFVQREQLISTIIHELAHYIDYVYNGFSSHGKEFWDIYHSLMLVGYEKQIVEID